MTTDVNIHRTVQLCIKQHGDDATIHAAMRADELLDKGNLAGRAVWLRVMGAIKEL